VLGHLAQCVEHGYALDWSRVPLAPYFEPDVAASIQRLAASRSLQATGTDPLSPGFRLSVIMNDLTTVHPKRVYDYGELRLVLSKMRQARQSSPQAATAQPGGAASSSLASPPLKQPPPSASVFASPHPPAPSPSPGPAQSPAMDAPWLSTRPGGGAKRPLPWGSGGGGAAGPKPTTPSWKAPKTVGPQVQAHHAPQSHRQTAPPPPRAAPFAALTATPARGGLYTPKYVAPAKAPAPSPAPVPAPSPVVVPPPSPAVPAVIPLPTTEEG
jgi:hypothetical protein